ncbi:beta-mannosidase [Frateuria terrea]|uniref:Beta-mannosidase B n=1 Tax=Frateuria terrea TaxID=529704 RepID=A0A1H6RBF1_9GAMM|nr:glycoside hydrolase family 2 protein [Frateuria terrea]SEI51806.1 beta-mannosidase [Frateuria terrea]SFP16612.1 beta-mannosidase [Frateuria terrea]
MTSPAPPTRPRPMPRTAGLALALLALPGLAAAAAPLTQVLDQGWQLRLAPGDTHATAHPQATRWLPATVPGTVQTDLMAAGFAAGPFVRDNEAAIQWVGLSDWVYRTTFTVDQATLARRHAELVFDGLDTFAEVYLNGHKLLSADNMFRRWAAPAKPWLHAGANTLEVRLYSPIRRLQPWLSRQPYALPGEFDSAFGDEPKGRQSAGYVRKAAYQYGWDWGPRIVTEGIWQRVHLDSWNALRVTGYHVAQQHLDDVTAQTRVQLDVQADAATTLPLDVRVLGPDGAPVAHLAQPLRIEAGRHTVEVPLTIDHPRRWYPAGYGAQDMYVFEVRLGDGDDVRYRGTREIGLRTVELRRDKDAWGTGFAFVVNGIPVFAKGANLIPFDSFPTRVGEAQMRQVLTSARDANMNMLRVWGGGTYLPDDFYAMADRLGLMVWQDFMFGGAITPYDPAYAGNVRQEAIEQVERLRDHPSIVLWCGNNEVQSGWLSWDDRKAFRQSIGPAEAARIEQGMRDLFGTELREVVARHAPGVPYWPSSPSEGGDGFANGLDAGDYHYWEVWSGQARPASAYLDVTPRFQSEYGLQSIPSIRTIRAFAGAGDLKLDSPVLRAHQKYDSGNGNARLAMYVHREYGQPKDFPALVYLSQVMQAEGIGLAAEHLRASRPRSMGSLYWQLNDVWPAISWSSIDYYGRWKALQFHARRFYAPLLATALREHGTTQVTLVSDRTTPVQARWRLRVMDFAGRVISEQQHGVTLAPLAATPVGSFGDAQLADADPRSRFAAVDLLVDGRSVSRSLVFFGAPRQLALPQPHIHAGWAPSGDGYTLTLDTDALAREVWLSFGQVDAQISDNAFDLLPGEPVSLHVRSAAGLDVLRRALRMQDLASAMQKGTP